MNVLDIFSGIGGFSLGLERAGMRTVAFCEIEPFCQAVLRKDWPGVPIYSDIRELSAQHLTADRIAVDAICGGFPCQDISEVGRGEGIEGSRSSLWREYARIISEVRPRYIIVENVSALLGRGLSTVLGDLAALGYDAEWQSISAADVGAPHIRERIWIVAYPDSRGRRSNTTRGNDTNGTDTGRSQADGVPREICQTGGARQLADADATGHEGAGCELPWRRPILTGSFIPTDRQWETEPELDRVANGVPNWSHRIASLGNAVVPQIPEIIGRAIMNNNQSSRSAHALSQ